MGALVCVGEVSKVCEWFVCLVHRKGIRRNVIEASTKVSTCSWKRCKGGATGSRGSVREREVMKNGVLGTAEHEGNVGCLGRVTTKGGKV